MGLFKGQAAAARTAGEEAMEAAKGWSILPAKEQGLARAIVAGFAAELEQHRNLTAELDARARWIEEHELDRLA